MTGADPGVPWDDVIVRRGGGELRLRVFRPCPVPTGPTAGGTGCLVWAHGGSWVAGSVESWHRPCADLARRTGVVVASVDYRLAPQHWYPAPVDDVVLGVEWAADRFDGPVAVGGDSAGGTLAACAAVRCRDEGLALSLQLLAYPPLDPSCPPAAYHDGPGAFPSRSGLLAAWRAYRGPDPGVVGVTPFDAAHLRGVAPAVVVVGERDPVAQDARRYVTTLRAQGNRADLELLEATDHGVFLDAGAAGTALRSRLGAALHTSWKGVHR